jgi:hypothetical protein
VKRRYRFITPGAVFCVITWVALGLGFRLYIDQFAIGGYNRTYGLVLQSSRPHSKSVQGTLTACVPVAVVAYWQVLRHCAAKFALAIRITKQGKYATPSEDFAGRTPGYRLRSRVANSGAGTSAYRSDL